MAPAPSTPISTATFHNSKLAVALFNPFVDRMVFGIVSGDEVYNPIIANSSVGRCLAWDATLSSADAGVPSSPFCAADYIAAPIILYRV